jgi:hypothetical protein
MWDAQTWVKLNVPFNIVKRLSLPQEKATSKPDKNHILFEKITLKKWMRNKCIILALEYK